MTPEIIIQIKNPQDSSQDKNLALYGSAVPIRKAQMPGEDVTELHPDDAKALKEREELKRKRQEYFSLAFSSGIKTFQGDIEPNGGYDTNGQPGDILKGMVIEIESELEKTA